jgi:hypothetical protein
MDASDLSVAVTAKNDCKSENTQILFLGSGFLCVKDTIREVRTNIPATVSPRHADLGLPVSVILSLKPHQSFKIC